MTAHAWDSSTPYCVRCGIQKGWHAEECLATANVVGFMHHLAKRRWEREGKMLGTNSLAPLMPKPSGQLIVEAFPPTESV